MSLYFIIYFRICHFLNDAQFEWYKFDPNSRLILLQIFECINYHFTLANQMIWNPLSRLSCGYIIQNYWKFTNCYSETTSCMYLQGSVFSFRRLIVMKLSVIHWDRVIFKFLFSYVFREKLAMVPLSGSSPCVLTAEFFSGVRLLKDSLSHGCFGNAS